MRDFFLILIRPIFFFTCRPATKLHFKICRRHHMINVGQTNTAHIAPNGDGVVTGVTYTASGGYDVAMAADGLSAVYTATTPGTGFTATVTAVNSVGTTLTETQPLDDVQAVPNPATALNLTITNP